MSNLDEIKQSALEKMISKLWVERANLINQKIPNTEQDKKHHREKLKIVTDDLYKFIELLETTRRDLRQQKLDLLELRKKETDFVDTDQVEF